MSNGNRAFRVAATSARVIMGVAVIAACVVGVATAIHAPWPTVAHFPAQVEVTPVPGDSVLVCNGDLRALGRDASAPWTCSPRHRRASRPEARPEDRRPRRLRYPICPMRVDRRCSPARSMGVRHR